MTVYGTVVNSYHFYKEFKTPIVCGICIGNLIVMSNCGIGI